MILLFLEGNLIKGLVNFHVLNIILSLAYFSKYDRKEYDNGL